MGKRTASAAGVVQLSCDVRGGSQIPTLTELVESLKSQTKGSQSTNTQQTDRTVPIEDCFLEEVKRLAGGDPLPILLHVAKHDGPDRYRYDGQNWQRLHGPFFPETGEIIGVYLPADNADEWKLAKNRYSLIKDWLWPCVGTRLIASARSNELARVRTFVTSSVDIRNTLDFQLGFQKDQPQPEQMWIAIQCLFRSIIELTRIEPTRESELAEESELDEENVKLIREKFQDNKDLRELKELMNMTFTKLLSIAPIVEFLRTEAKSKTQDDLAAILKVNRTLISEAAQREGIKFQHRGKNFRNSPTKQQTKES